MLDKFFKLSEHRTNVRTEVMAGLTTFLTMAYIVFVNPSILSKTGMDFHAVMAATCLAAAISTTIMGLWANYPIALAPGMGLNAFFAFTVVMAGHHSWQVALGAVFISGAICVTLSVLPVRTWIINSIPQTLKMAIAAGIGLFLAMIGLKSAGIVIANPATFVGLGDFTQPNVVLAVVGFLAMVVLSAWNVPGAMVIAILGVTAIGILLGVSEFKGIFDTPPDITPTLLQLDIVGALQAGMLATVFTMVFVDLFDTAGTLIGVAHRGGLLDKDGNLPRLGKTLVSDSSATLIGSLLGTSNTTSYVESAAGINAGGRTGLTAVVVAILFLLCLFLAPLASTVPDYATAPALVFVACLMTRSITEINWDDLTDVAPAVVTAISMPLTFSIANGIGLGFITYAVAKLLGGRPKEATPVVIILAVAFALKFAFLGA